MQNAPPSTRNSILGYILFGIFVVAGCYTFKILSLEPLMNFIHSKNWVKVSCEVKKSEIQRSRGTKSDTYKINIQYRYEYQNNAYSGNNYNFISFSSSGYSGKKKIIDNYPVGKQFFCYVDPTHPSQSVINRSFDWYLLLTLLPLLFAIVGILGIYTTYKQNNPTALTLRNSTSSTDMIVLQEASSPLKNFIIILLICLFWNGCVLIMYNAWWLDAYTQLGHIPIGASFFLLIFGIAGLLLIYGVFYSFLNIFNPTINMKINAGKLHLGGEYTLRFNLQGNIQRLRNISFVLKGTEQTTNARGKNSQTQEHVFCEKIFYQQESRNLTLTGEISLSIPQDIMPSFSSAHNKILWAIVAKGSIALWPDMNHEFPITIYPTIISGEI